MPSRRIGALAAKIERVALRHRDENAVRRGGDCREDVGRDYARDQRAGRGAVKGAEASLRIIEGRHYAAQCDSKARHRKPSRLHKKYIYPPGGLRLLRAGAREVSGHDLWLT